MRGSPSEYAVRKDVRNNPILREVDRDRHRELWRLGLVGAFLTAVVLFSAWQHFQLLRQGYELENLQRDRSAEREINRRLRLEVETLNAPQRIEALALHQLQLTAPGRGDAFIIERTTPAEAPSKSIVAMR